MAIFQQPLAQQPPPCNSISQTIIGAPTPTNSPTNGSASPNLPNTNTNTTTTPPHPHNYVELNGSSSSLSKPPTPQNFEEASSSIAATMMKNELTRLISMLDKAPSSPEKILFQSEMDGFFHLFTRYLSEKSRNVKL